MATTPKKPSKARASTRKPRPPAPRLEDALAEATRAAFEQVRAAHPDDTFYGFVLYTTADGDYVVPTAFSEEGLTRVCDRYHGTGKYPDADKLRRDLRFSAPDSPYHELAGEAFEGLPSGPKLHDACFAALARLDDEVFFGKGAKRDAMVVNVVYGDMSDERWLAHAKRLNGQKTIETVMPFLRLNLPSGQVTQWGGKAYATNALSLSRDRALVAYSGSGGDIGVFRAATHKAVRVTRRRGEHWASQLTPDGTRLFLGDADGIYLLDIKSGTVRPFVKTPKPSTLALSPDGAWLAATDWEGPMKVFDAASGKQAWSEPDIETIVFTADARALMVIAVRERDGTWGGFLERRDARTGALQWSCSVGGAFDLAIACAEDGSILVASSTEARSPATVRWIAADDGRVTGTFKVAQAIGALAISPDRRHVAWCSGRRLVIADDQGREIASGTGGQEQLSDCAFLDDRRAIAVGRDVNTGPAILELTATP